MIKILVINRLSPFRVAAGIERIAREIMLRLPRMGVEVHSLYGRAYRSAPQLVNPYSYNQIYSHFIWHPLTNSPIDTALFWAYARRHIKNIIREREIDLVIYHGCDTSFLEKGLFTPKIYYAHGPVNASLPSFWRYERKTLKLRTLKRIFYLNLGTLMEFSGVHGATLCIATSRHSAYWIARYYNLPSERIRIISGGVDLDKFHPTNQPGRGILFVGQDLWRKNLRTLMLGMSKLPEKYRQLTVIGGRDSYHERLARTLHLNVNFLGTASEDTLVKHFQTCKIFACPSFHEGFGLNFLEAQACGKPCLGSWMGAIPEIVKHGHTGLLVRPTNIDEMAETLIRLLEDEGECMGKEAREWAKNFSWDKVISRTLSIYDEAVKCV